IGSGETNQNFAKYLKKHQHSNFVVFNRTLKNAQKLARELNGEAYSLSELAHYKKGFDVMIICTGAPQARIDVHLYKYILQGETVQKVNVDMAIPYDLVV